MLARRRHRRHRAGVLARCYCAGRVLACWSAAGLLRMGFLTTAPVAPRTHPTDPESYKVSRGPGSSEGAP
eukprot:11158949-Lingulodinium_polyedra.AAC.1